MTKALQRSTPAPRAYQRVVDDLEKAIRTGSLTPGSRLSSERDLCEQYGVSRSSVREALRVLESMHLIEFTSGDRRGPLVLPFSPEPARKSLSQMAMTLSLSDLVQFRMIADATANLMAARLRTPAHLIELERNLARMRESMSHGYRVFSASDLEFHEIVARAAGNQVIQVCGDIVRESILSLISQTIVDADDQGAIMLQSIRHHQEVFDAISRQDGALASRLARESLYAYYAGLVDDSDRMVLADLVLEVGGHII